MSAKDMHNGRTLTQNEKGTRFNPYSSPSHKRGKQNLRKWLSGWSLLIQEFCSLP